MHSETSLANEYAAKIKALNAEYEEKMHALYREFQEKAGEQKASTEDLTHPSTGFCSQNDQPSTTVGLEPS